MLLRLKFNFCLIKMENWLRNHIGNLNKEEVAKLLIDANKLVCLSEKAAFSIEEYLITRGATYLFPSLATKLSLIPEISREKNLYPSKTHKDIDSCLEFNSDYYVEEVASNAISLSTYSILEAIKRLFYAKGTIRKIFNIDVSDIHDIHFHGGETHNGGRQVIFFFCNGGNVVYKPVDLRAQRFFEKASQKILSEIGLNKKGAPEVIYAGKNNYGFMEYIDINNKVLNKNSINDYYYKLGALLALAHCFKVVDLHHENVLITNNGPVLLDIETLFYPFPIEYSSTIIDTGLIGDSNLSGIEGGGIRKKIGIHVNQADKLKIDYTKKVWQGNNKILSTCDDQVVLPSKYKNDIVQGFSIAYDHIFMAKEDLSESAYQLMKENISCRYILRLTRYYTVKQLNLVQPKKTDSSRNLHKIKKQLLEDIRGIDKLKSHKIVETEFRDLLRGDIPYFHTKSLYRHLYNSNEVASRNYSDKSQYQLLKKFFNDISNRDKHQQIEIIFQLMN